LGDWMRWKTCERDGSNNACHGRICSSAFPLSPVLMLPFTSQPASQPALPLCHPNVQRPCLPAGAF
jgi:hypothetical protein